MHGNSDYTHGMNVRDHRSDKSSEAQGPAWRDMLIVYLWVMEAFDKFQLSFPFHAPNLHTLYKIVPFSTPCNLTPTPHTLHPEE